MSKLSWHDRKRGKCGMHLVLNRKQFSHHVNPSLANVNAAREKGAVTQVRINSVAIVRRNLVKFMEFFGRCTAHLVRFQLYLCFLCADNVQQMENANW